MELINGDIGAHIRRIAIPASIGFIFSTLYNVTDTFYAGLLGSDALAALGVTFPMFFAVMAVGAGLSQGTNALVSNYLGSNNRQKAYMIAKQAISYAFLLSLLLSTIGFFIAPSVFRMLGLTESTLPYAISYMNILFFGLSLFLLAYVTNAPLLASGDTKSIRNVFMIGFFLNIALNPLFMFVFNLGVAGIAAATVTIYLFNVLYYVRIGYKRGIYKGTKIKDFIPRKEYGKELFTQAIPAGMNMLTTAIGIIIITFYFGRFGESAIAAYGVATRIEQIVLLPIIGLNMAVLSLTGQNYGAKKIDRVRLVLKTALQYGFIVITIGSVLLFFGGRLLMRFFTQDPAVVSIGNQYLAIASFILWAYLILFVSQSFFQGLKRPWIIFGVSILRQIIFPLVLFSYVVYILDSMQLLFWSIFAINWILALGLYAGSKIYLKKLS
ncbi:MAG: MATE family efflux transporter [Candidatus Woesearchaeota archaeon]